MTNVRHLRFPLPENPWSTNQDRNLNPYRRADIIKAWKEATALYYKVQIGGELPPSIIQVTIPVPTNRRRDPHNYCGTVLKAIIDGLVRAGAWPDDTPDYVGHREPVLYKSPKGEVIVTITPMSTNQEQEIATT